MIGIAKYTFSLMNWKVISKRTEVTNKSLYLDGMGGFFVRLGAVWFRNKHDQLSPTPVWKLYRYHTGKSTTETPLPSLRKR